MSIDKKLVDEYNDVYANGEEKFWTFIPKQERIHILKRLDLVSKTVMEIGCGSGDFAAWTASCGPARVVAYDVSHEAIDLANLKYNLQNLEFYCDDPCGYTFPKESMAAYDFIVLLGVLEHVDDPAKFLDTIHHRFTVPGTTMAISCPCFLNPRGFIWLALKYLFDAPMSLTDRHELGPSFYQAWAVDRRWEIEHVDAVDNSWGCGHKMIEDYSNRLPKVFPELPPEKINRFLNKLQEDIQHTKSLGLGANSIYYLTRK